MSERLQGKLDHGGQTDEIAIQGTCTNPGRMMPPYDAVAQSHKAADGPGLNVNPLPNYRSYTFLYIVDDF